MSNSEVTITISKEDERKIKRQVKEKFDFIAAFENQQKRAHDNAVEKGFWDKDPCDAQLIALCHSELSEMLEAVRAPDGGLGGYVESDKIPDFTAVEEEAADCVIRLMDMMEARGLNLGCAILAKMEYNSTRPRMHGGKKF